MYERGGARLNLVLTLLVLGTMLFTAIKIVPVYINNYQFNDAMATEARFALSGIPHKTEDDIRDDIYKEAVKDGVNIKRDDIKAEISGSLVNITVDYSVPIDLKVYQFTMHFHCLADNHTI